MATLFGIYGHATRLGEAVIIGGVSPTPSLSTLLASFPPASVEAYFDSPRVDLCFFDSLREVR